jgi:predicted  nucleic acid-binding Zn-ribbon protein
MEASKKIARYIKNSLSAVGSLLAPGSPEAEARPADGSAEWSNNNDTVIIKRAELESMQTELFECGEAIKRLRSRDIENQSQIQDYEAMFTKFLRRSIGRGEAPGEPLPSAREKYEDEIARLRSSEDRLRSHVQALKRDLVAAEERSEHIGDSLEQRLASLRIENDALEDELRAVDYESKRLSLANEELKAALERGREELVEVIAYCRYLLK